MGRRRDEAKIVREAKHVIRQEQWRVLEERAIEALGKTCGLACVPLSPRSRLVQFVAYNGKLIGHVRMDRPGWGTTWVAVPARQSTPCGRYLSAGDAARALASLVSR